jgi:phenylalanyl-tRNA synthetase beta chain
VRFSDEWLRDCLETQRSPAQIGETLTGVGIPLDSLEALETRGKSAADTVYHFDISTNRPDCMNHVGLARELSAAGAGRLRPAGAAKPPQPSAGKIASVKVEAADLCGRYSALVMQEVRVAPSPAWVSRRLEAIGLRSINAVVDATNYTLWEMGQPLHAFDLAKVSGHAIRVRRAKTGERLTTLDGVERKLDPETLVIADERRALALAGVMGGRDSEIGPSTTEILIESAHFQPASVRATARRFGLRTDASHRFERGADPEITLTAAARCAELIAEWSGGRVAAALEDRPVPPQSRTIALRPARVCRLLGLEIDAAEMRSILERLGCRVDSAKGETWSVVPPSYRGDLALEEDLVEEIARHHGYDRIPTTLPRAFVFPEGRPEVSRLIESASRAARECGFSEALNLSLVPPAGNLAFGDASSGVVILNPLTEGSDRLRSSLIPGLLRNLEHNLNHHAGEVRLFETGHVFHATARNEPPAEEERLGLAAAARAASRHWSEPLRAPDFFDVKGVIETAARLVGVGPLEWKAAERSFLREGSGAEIRAAQDLLGWSGELEPALLSDFGLEVPVFVAEISLTGMGRERPQGSPFRHASLSRTPAVSRDLSLLLDERHSWSQVEATIRSVTEAPVVSVRLFDRYTGAPVPAGKVSLAVNVLFSTPGRTMLSEEVSEHLERIVQRLRDRLGAALRGQ